MAITTFKRYEKKYLLDKGLRNVKVCRREK